MSLYGALYSGVAGLAAQSNKIGQLSDNISNVNTVGYKGTRANFESLVTNSGAAAAYSPGGVLGGSQQLVSKQGLLQSTDSATDIAISGGGFFVVNTQNDGLGSVLYTRAGSFTQDSTGNFKNSAGFFLQAWPLDREGRLPGESGNLNTTSSANLTSLRTVNVKNLTGVAAATTNVAIGANLKSDEGVYPGASGTLSPDQLSTENDDLKAKDIIVPGGPNSLTRGDRFTISNSGGSLSYTYRYGGFTYGRDITNNNPATNAGDSGQAVLTNQTTITQSAVALPATTTLTTVLSSNVVTVHTTLAHGLQSGDYVTLAGITGTAGFVDGTIPIAQLNTTHIVTVTGTNTYTITTVANATAGGNQDEASATATALPFVSTANSNVVTVRQVAHGLKDGDVVRLAGNATALGAIPFGDLNGTFIVNVTDDDHYTITVASTEGGTATGGGTGTVVATTRLFTSGIILDATNTTTPFLGTTGISPFSAAALGFNITTGGTTFNFTYSSSPTTSNGTFNNMTTLVDAINSKPGLTARISAGRLYVSALDANAAVTFQNGSDVGSLDAGAVKWGIDWKRELGLQDVLAATGTDAGRFSTLEGLKTLVNNSSGLTAVITSPLARSTLKINIDNPLDTITFSDRATVAAVSLGTTPFTMAANSSTVTVTLPAPATTLGYVEGDLIDLTTTGGPYNGITAANLTGRFAITNITSNTFDIVAKNDDEASGTVTNPAGPSNVSFTAPTNHGSFVAEFGIAGTASLNNASYTPQTTPAIGPAYDTSVPAKNMAGGGIVPQFSRPIRVYDSLGTGHDLTVAFIKSGVNRWEAEIYAATPDELPDANPNGLLASGTITFNGDGSLQSVDNTLINAEAAWTNGAVSSEIAFNWGTAGDPFGTPNSTVIGKTDGLSQFNSGYRVNFTNQNGAPVGDLTGVSITEEGFIVASYSNGQTQRLFRIPLADFANPNELQTSSGNVFTQSASSGEVNLRQPGSSGVGKVSASSLEQSNVELADQLTDMIVAQRAYQANTKIISTTDQLLSQLNDILR